MYGSCLLGGVEPREDITIGNDIVSEIACWSPTGPHVALWPAQRALRGQLVEYLLREIHNRMVEIPSPHSKLVRLTERAKRNLKTWVSLKSEF